MYILTTDASITDRSEDKKQHKNRKKKTFKVTKNLFFQDILHFTHSLYGLGKPPWHALLESLNSSSTAFEALNPDGIVLFLLLIICYS